MGVQAASRVAVTKAVTAAHRRARAAGARYEGEGNWWRMILFGVRRGGCVPLEVA